MAVNQPGEVVFDFANSCSFTCNVNSRLYDLINLALNREGLIDGRHIVSLGKFTCRGLDLTTGKPICGLNGNIAFEHNSQPVIVHTDFLAESELKF